MTIADRICYVAFDGVFSSYALDVSEKIPVYSVVNSTAGCAGCRQSADYGRREGQAGYLW
mgnify:CR=1 FL=1